MKKHLFRVLEDGEEIWRGEAANEEMALETALGEETSNLTYEIQAWGDKKISGSMKMKDWVFCWRGKID